MNSMPQTQKLADQMPETQAAPVVIPVTGPQADPFWYKDTVIYQIHVKAFFDSNNDGIGDFPGLTAKLDYIQDLGVNTLWLLPFYPSPLRDDGYDIADYCDVNPSYGNLDDFKHFVHEAHRRGLRIITELVINHTSDKHAWFQRARLAPPRSKERDYYVWSDTNQKYEGTRIIFSDTETSNWTWDPEAKAYYWHRFFSHQPDLNFDNPDVLQEVIDVMYFWLDMGVDGLRLDAVPYLCEREGTNNENLPETHEILRKIRAAMDARYPDRMLLAEANQWPEDVLPYFGKGDECHMAFHFPLMPRIYMAVAQEDRHPVTDIMYQTPTIPENCQWALFLRNHDELTLEMVTNRERDYLWNFYAADKQARINFGIRRRLAPLMENDRRKIELLNSLLLSMPGTPVLYYGDEIGMGDNIFLGDRNGVRTPMQWSPDRNGGFSRCEPAQLFLPAVMDAVYGYQSINVETQTRVQNSLYNWMRKIIGTIKSTRVFGRGALRFLSPSNRTVLAYLRQYEGETILCVANLSRSPQAVELNLAEFSGYIPVEMLGQSRFPAIGQLPYLLTLSPFGFYWFRLTKKVEDEIVTKQLPELLTLVLPKGWTHLFEGNVRQLLEEKLLPSFLMTRRWYKGKNAELPRVEIKQIYKIGAHFRYLVMTTTTPDGTVADYTMTLGIEWDDSVDDPFTRLQKDAISKVRTFNRVGILYEATNYEKFIADIISLVSRGPIADQDNATLTLNTIAEIPPMEALPVTPLSAEQTNSSALIGNIAVVKFVRQPLHGINPEEEVCDYLTRTSPYDRTPKLLASLQTTDKAGDALTVGLIYQAIRNQGNGWDVTSSYLDRMLQDIISPSTMAKEDKLYAENFAEQLGKRTGELHMALTQKSHIQDFDPEAVTDVDRNAWITGAEELLQRALSHVEHALPTLSEHAKEYAEKFLAARDKLQKRIHDDLPQTIATPKTRVHGDYHLGQVLVAESDFFIIDFEGEPARGLDDRRRKTSPFKDVAGMLRSFDYAAATAWNKLDKQVLPQKKDVETSLRSWIAKTRESFLNGYYAAGHSADGPETRQALLRFFTLEKALYEIVYEAQHRPDWLTIPLYGVLEILDQVEQKQVEQKEGDKS